MVTQAKEAMEKAATPTRSPVSALKANAPHLRTHEQILEKNEQIADGLEHGTITPKTGEQLQQCCKTPIALARLELSYHKTIQSFGKKAPVPRSPILRSVIGLPEDITPADGATVRAMLPDK